jgi:hypothetical protein
MSKFEVLSATQKREKLFPNWKTGTFPCRKTGIFPAGRKFSQCIEMLTHLEHYFLWEKYHLVPDYTIYVLLIFLEIAGVSKSLHEGKRGKM